jgi:putative FmdB family regulatory protein
MPIYEFYCPDCHTIFNFLSMRVETSKRPCCPRCHRPDLERRASIFSISKGLEQPDDEGMPDIDESKMEQAMQLMAREADSIDEDDPKQAARLMKKLFDSTGLEMGPSMEEAMRRMEAGEDPEQIEADLGDALESEDFFAAARKVAKGQRPPPARDDTIYDL